MSPTYARGTPVPPNTTRAEIERTLERFGADQVAFGWSDEQAMVAFVMRDWQIRLMLLLPDPSDSEFTQTPTGRSRTAAQAQQSYLQMVKERWRALALIIKAKLVAVESGVVTLETEFGPYIVLPDGTTMRDHMVPAISQAYATGEMPALLPPHPSTRSTR